MLPVIRGGLPVIYSMMIPLFVAKGRK